MSLWEQGSLAVTNGDTAEAVACFGRLVESDPEEPAHHWSLGMALLAAGDYERGFEEIEWRWHPLLNGNDFDKQLKDVPRWRGESLVGKSIVLFHEWGLGDAIMMLRYLPGVKLLAGSVVVVLPKPVCGLACVPAFDAVPDQHFDFKLSLFSLPRVFGIWPEPYIKPDPERVDRWRPWIGNAKRKIGIAWSGHKDNARDAARSIELKQFLRLLKPKRCDLFSVQATDYESAGQNNVRTFEFESFADTAALMSLMDCIVTVDTAAAHLAGAIGHPNVNVMLGYAHDWRWYRSAEWYPKIKTYRQERLAK
jgi:hypothetical protein